MHDTCRQGHGSYIDPAKSKIKTGECAAMAGRTVSSQGIDQALCGIVSKHIEPRWEHVPLAEVWHADVVA
jgi:hypothetical protein